MISCWGLLPESTCHHHHYLHQAGGGGEGEGRVSASGQKEKYMLLVCLICLRS